MGDTQLMKLLRATETMANQASSLGLPLTTYLLQIACLSVVAELYGVKKTHREPRSVRRNELAELKSLGGDIQVENVMGSHCGLRISSVLPARRVPAMRRRQP